MEVDYADQWHRVGHSHVQPGRLVLEGKEVSDSINRLFDELVSTPKLMTRFHDSWDHAWSVAVGAVRQCRYFEATAGHYKTFREMSVPRFVTGECPAIPEAERSTRTEAQRAANRQLL